MLEGQNYRQLIQEHGVIEQSIASGWGYDVNPNEFIPKKQKLRTNMKVAKIEPLRHLSNIPISRQLQKIDEEILMMQNQRKLQELTEQAKVFLEKEVEKEGEDSAAVKMMHQLVDQYNFIVQHRHIVEKNSEKARKILGIQKKTAAQLISQQIQQLKEQLANSSFSQVVKINQKIAELYKKYQANLFVTKSTTEHNTTIKNPSNMNRTTTEVSAITNSYIGSSKSPGKKTSKQKSSAQTSSYPHSHAQSQKRQEKGVDIKDLVIMQQLNESQDGDSVNNYNHNMGQYVDRLQPQSVILDNCLNKMQRRTSEYAVRRRMVTSIDGNQRERQLKRQRLATSISESIVQRDVIDKGRSLDKAIRENKEVIDVWKDRINTNAAKIEATFLRFPPKAKSFQKNSFHKNEDNINMLSDKIEVLERQYPLRPDKLTERINMAKAQMKVKQQVLSIILRRKQSKYKRIPGTQILQKNDATETAKTILGISHNRQSKTLQKKTNTSDHRLIKKGQEEDVPEWMNIGHDEQLYWSMCRNEKINLLLKHK